MGHHFGGDLESMFLIEGQFSAPFVILSIVFVIVGTFTAFSMHDRINDNSLFPKSVWFFLASFALAFGIWAMHYMGMFAYELPITVKFNALLTAVSFLPIFFAGYTSFYLSYKKQTSIKAGIISGVILALGVVLMHFIGMYSMVSETYHHYSAMLLISAFFISFIAHCLFYVVRIYLNRPIVKLLFAILMGSMLSLTHYTAMIWMKVYVSDEQVLLDGPIPVAYRNESATILTSIFIVILLFLLVSSIADKYIQYRAEHYDVLTKLPNIRMFEQTLEKDIETNISIIQLKDLHKCFTETNYLSREAVIREIALRIEQNMSPHSTLYRTDYYQFVLVSKSNDAHFTKYLSKIRAALNKPYKLILTKDIIPPFIILEANRGVQTTLELLFERLKATLIEMPLTNEIVNFEQTLNKMSEEEEILESFKGALYKNEFFIVYQPKFNANTNNFSSVEALIRWVHPVKGFISPGVFIPVLEKHEEIFDLTDWIVFSVCRQLNEWKQEGCELQSVSINIPGAYVSNNRLKRTLIDAVTRYNISPSQLELEITETSYVGNIAEASESVSMYRNLGFKVAIDDFGTGLSSLSYLKQLPITTLKIDKSFVDEVPTSEKDSEIIKGIISIAASLNLNIVIEGVEHEEQKEFIHQHFKDVLIQGYYYSKPLPPMELQLLYQQKHRESALTVDM